MGTLLDKPFLSGHPQDRIKFQARPVPRHRRYTFELPEASLYYWPLPMARLEATQTAWFLWAFISPKPSNGTALGVCEMGLGNKVDYITKLPGFRSLRPLAAGIQRSRLRRLILAQYRGSEDQEVREIIDFLSRHSDIPLPMDALPPYDYIFSHISAPVEVHSPDNTGFPRAVCGDHSVYFPKGMTQEEIANAVRTARIEQDPRSPHCYLSDAHAIAPGDVAVLAGASDGIFCLSIIDRISKAYLFEPDPRWWEPLALTLRPWKARVQIIRSCLGDKATRQAIALDDLLGEDGRLNFLQADVEGAEMTILHGARRTLSGSGNIRLSICSYHGSADFDAISGILGEYGFAVRPSRGYFVMGLRPPFLRRAVVYASK